MATLVPRSPYAKDELEKLYPDQLQLQLVQILHRHGERTPVSPRFQNTGLGPYWPYCNHARQLTSVIKTTADQTKFDDLRYRRRLETFGVGDIPIVATGPTGEFESICNPGELTDKGRETTLALGQRLRRLYVNQLQFMPHVISDTDIMYIRATSLPRALESVQQVFWGMYPPEARAADFPPPTILTRTPADETLYPNDGNCRRLAQLSRAFAQRTADKWDESDELNYVNKSISKWMPEASPRIGVNSHPRLVGILDTINATDAHGPATKLPKEFYDPKLRSIVDKISVEEWYTGYTESQEYRMLGIGALAGDIVSRMTARVERNRHGGLAGSGSDGGHLGRGEGSGRDIKFALSGCHDTTLASVLSSLGAFEGEPWPPYTSHVAIELFRTRARSGSDQSSLSAPPADTAAVSAPSTKPQGWWPLLFGRNRETGGYMPSGPPGIARKPVSELSPQQRNELKGYYVRIRYNDKVMQVPGCKAPGKHWEGDASFCTLEAFKAIVDKFTPKVWKEACTENLDKPPFPETKEPAGYE